MTLNKIEKKQNYKNITENRHAWLLACCFYLDKFWRQFKGRTFESEILWRTGQDEPVVDVDEVALVVQEDIAVVAILDLDQVRDDAVRRTGFDKLSLGCQERL